MTESKWPPQRTATAPTPKKPAKRKPAKKVEYIVHLRNHEPLYVKGPAGKVAAFLKDGVSDGDTWHPLHQIIRVERRGT